MVWGVEENGTDVGSSETGNSCNKASHEEGKVVADSSAVLTERSKIRLGGPLRKENSMYIPRTR